MRHGFLEIIRESSHRRKRPLDGTTAMLEGLSGKRSVQDPSPLSLTEYLVSLFDPLMTPSKVFQPPILAESFEKTNCTTEAFGPDTLECKYNCQSAPVVMSTEYLRHNVVGNISGDFVCRAEHPAEFRSYAEALQIGEKPLIVALVFE